MPERERTLAELLAVPEVPTDEEHRGGDQRSWAWPPSSRPRQGRGPQASSIMQTLRSKRVAAKKARQRQAAERSEP